MVAQQQSAVPQVEGVVAAASAHGAFATSGASVDTTEVAASLTPNEFGSDVPQGLEIDEAAYRAAKEAARRIQTAGHTGAYATDDAGSAAAPASPQAPPFLGVSYEAIPYTGWRPPDPIITVAPDGVLAAVNSSLYIFSKSNPGVVLFSSTFSSWLASLNLPAGTSIFDPKVIYDYINKRAIIVVLAKNESVTPNLSSYLIIVSRQQGVIGSWYAYQSDARFDGTTLTNNWADYPGIATDGVNLYVSANMFALGGGPFQYSKVRMFKLSELYSGSLSSGYWDFWSMTHNSGDLAFTVQPAHRYLVSSPIYLVSAENNLSASSGNRLTLFRVDGRTTWPGTPPSFVRVATVNTNTFTSPPDAEQLGTTTRIDTGDDRVLSARAYANDIWLTQTTECLGTSCVRLIEISTTGDLLFQTTWGSPGSTYYYYPSVAIDDFENIAVVFSRSGPSEYVQMRYTGKLKGDPGLLDSALVKAGEDSYINFVGSRNRWGDYSGVERDTSNYYFWMFNEYAKPAASGAGRWSTWIATAGWLPRKLYLPLISR